MDFRLARLVPHGPVVSTRRVELRSYRWRRLCDRSFTLVELLVAIAILSILTLVLLAMLGSLTTVWQQGQARNERRTIGQAVLDRMTRDISQATIPLSRTTNSLEFVINPSWISTTQYPQCIFFQAPVATDGGISGNLAVVGYFVQWLNGTPGTPTLSRLLINPSDPSGAGTDYLVYSGSPNAWITSSLISTYAPSTAASKYQGLMSENVLGLWFQALDPSGNPITQSISTHKGEVFDSKYPYSYTNYITSTSVTVYTNAASAMPASVQVAIAVVDSRTAKRITAMPTYPALSGNFWGDIQSFTSTLQTNNPAVYKGMEIQSTIIPLANGPR